MKTFTFRYIPQNSKVHIITKTIPPKITTSEGIFRTHIYSAPFMGADDMIRNAVVAYQCGYISRSQVDIILSDNQDIKDIEHKEIPLMDLQGYCDSISMPLIVVLNAFCELNGKHEVQEVYFYEGRLKDDDHKTFRVKNKRP